MAKKSKKPVHPGAVLRDELLPATGLTQTDLASMIGVSRRAINEICQERRGVSTDMALRLARAFGNTPEFWLMMQQALDVWEAAESNDAEYRRIKPLEVA